MSDDELSHEALSAGLLAHDMVRDAQYYFRRGSPRAATLALRGAAFFAALAAWRSARLALRRWRA